MADNNDDLVIPVIWGLSLGIVFIVIFSVAAKPSFNMSDEEISSMVAQLPEVKALHERYQPTESFRHEGGAKYVDFAVERTWNFGDDPTCCGDITKELRLTVKVDSFGKTSIGLDCVGTAGGNALPATVEIIKNTTCLENAEQDAY